MSDISGDWIKTKFSFLNEIVVNYGPNDVGLNATVVVGVDDVDEIWLGEVAVLEYLEDPLYDIESGPQFMGYGFKEP